MAHDLIARLGRRAAASCAVMAIVAAVLTRDGWTAAAVIGGGVLIGISLATISGSVDAIAERRRARFILLVIAGRYALLAFLAYVMIARLRLPPLGLIAGASSVPIAVLLEALSRKPER